MVGYVLLAGLVSFAIIYRMGPPANPRTLNLIQWSMQAIGLLMVVLSSYHQVCYGSEQRAAQQELLRCGMWRLLT